MTSLACFDERRPGRQPSHIAMTPLIPQEIYLIERYSSLAYYQAMHDAWREMLAHVESCLARFMAQQPKHWRSGTPLHRPDMVEACLPNFQDTLQRLDVGYQALREGDLRGLAGHNGVQIDTRGQRDFNPDWMDTVEPGAAARYEMLLFTANHYAANIGTTLGARWCNGSLTKAYDEDARGPLNPPAEWPRYGLDEATWVRTAERVARTGIYLPGVADSCAALLLEGDEAPDANVGRDERGCRLSVTAATQWTLVVR